MIITISAKCSDCCFTQLLDGKNVVAENDGYVPEGLGIGGGDYVTFSLDLISGKIVDWEPIPANEAWKRFQG